MLEVQASISLVISQNQKLIVEISKMGAGLFFLQIISYVLFFNQMQTNVFMKFQNSL